MSLTAKIDRILQFNGAMVAPVTPFNSDGAVDYLMVEPYISYLSRIGAKGFFIHGTTGEGFSLTSEEKIKLTDIWWKEIKSKYPDLLGVFNVSATCIRETIEQTKYYDQLGVDAISVLPSLYYRPSSDEQLLKYLKTISDAAPSTPLIYYHSPARTNVNFRLKEFIAQAKKEVPRLVGMKYASVDMLELTRFCASRESNSFKIFTATEQTMLPMIALGVNAGMCSMFNLEEAVKGYTEMLKNFPHNMNEVMRIQEEMNALGDEMREGYFGSVIKNIKKKLNNLDLSDQLAFKVGGTRMPIAG